MEVERMSSHCIKPSCPTPKHLKIHKLSLLDQFVPSLYISMVLFYTPDRGTSTTNSLPKRLQLLKQSLSESLTEFYPLAGRIRDKLSIDCNDEGVCFSEAKVKYSLFEFFNQPSISSLIHKFLPTQPSWDDASEEASHDNVALIKVTSFTCGGLAIGVMVSHMIVDGAATSFFLNSWAATARGAFHNASPNFDAPPAIFPHNPKQANIMDICGPFLKTGKSTTRRLEFGAIAIDKLRAKASSLTVPNPTRVEVVSAVIWKCTMAAFKANSGLERPTLVNLAVNMRRRAVPAFPESFMGNFLWTARAEEKGPFPELPNLVIKLREAITKINSDFVKSLEGEEGYVRYSEVLKEMVESSSNVQLNFVGYTSWCRFGLYDVDFGWGKPKWVTSTGSTDADTVFLNSIVLMDTPSGDGIEAWVCLEEQLMTIFEQDKDLLAFATLDPNPLQLSSSVCHHARSCP